MKILVTGSTGLVGAEAVRHFRELGHEVVGIDCDMRSRMFGTPSKEPEIFADIRDENALTQLFNHNKFDAIIHTAAQPSHDWSKDHVLEDFKINALGTVLLLEYARQQGSIFVHCSTDKVYGDNMTRDVEERGTRYHSDFPFDETLSLDLTMRSPFGCSKTASDIYVQEYGRYFDMDTACFRCGCITGSEHAGSRSHGFLANVARCVKEDDTFYIDGYKGKQVRDNIHAYDLVRAFDEFIKKPSKGAVYNMGGGPDRSISVIEAIDLIQVRLGKEANVVYNELPRKGDRIWDVHDVSKFKADYPDWDYTYSLNDILEDLCKWS